MVGDKMTRFEEICWYIEEHLDEPLSVDDLAAQAHLSRYHFIRRFQRAHYYTPRQYLIHKRLERAKDLLANSELPVTEICFAVGFESLGSFSTLFHNVVGWSPSIYRARVWEQRRNPYNFIPGCMRMKFGITSAAQERNFQEAQAEQPC
ncbi:MAG: AraC family transcriptional regulator [Caldilineaceae bacterium]